jgi:hypothetical protein
MKVTRTLVRNAIILVIAALTSCNHTDRSEVEYQGRKIQVAKLYRDFDEYSSDTNNLTADQAKMVEAIMRKASFGPRFTNATHLITVLGSLQFPGYGYFLANQVRAHLDSKLDLAYVEIPRRNLNRYLALDYKSDGTLEVVDDFVASSKPEITRVRRRADGVLQYLTSEGTVVGPLRR